jgi:putative phosphoribosyl transferase
MTSSTTHEITIPAGGAVLPGTLVLPAGARGIVAFAHGSGSSRFSPRNQEAAAALQRAGFSTLLFDLLTAEEAATDAITREHRFDIALLGERLVAAIDWLRTHPETEALGIGVFGASTGAAAALVAAAERQDAIRAVVSRGGRPDLAGDALPCVQAPTLLLVGGRDTPVIDMNRWAQARIPATTELVIVPGATHLFEEPGTLDQVIAHAIDWFRQHLGVPGTPHA